MMNYYRAMDKSGLTIDFASTNEAPKVLKSELAGNGSRYFNLGSRKKHLFKYLKKISRLMQENDYDVIHVNGNSATMAFELEMAKRRQVPVRIAHGHTTRSRHPWLHRILLRFFEKSYTQGIAVSDQAGRWLFSGKDYAVLNNAIPIEKFKYDAAIRKKYRENLELTDKFVVGNVGKLYEAKNHSFLIQIFYELQKQKENAHLLLVGGGEMQAELEEQCRNLGISDSVTFLGMREDVSQLLQCMDVFVFPSLYEGLGLALIEAQASGLYCFASDNVPTDACVSSLLQYLNLDDSIERWKDALLGVEVYDREKCSLEACRSIGKHGYDISAEALRLQEIYSRL